MISDNYFDELLRQITPEVCYEEICDIEDQMIKEGEHVFPRDYEKKILSIYKGKNNKIREQSFHVGKTKPKIKYLLIAILLFVFSSITVCAYEPARQVLKEFFFSVYDEFILFHSESEDEKSSLESTQNKLFRPSYIPTGYELIDETENNTLNKIFMMWIDESERVLWYEQKTLKTGEIVLSSDGNIPTDIEIGEHMGKMIVEKDGMNTVFYEENSFLFIISGFIEKDELIQILLSLE